MGYNDFIVSAFSNFLYEKQYVNIVNLNIAELGLINQNNVFDFFCKEKPEYIFFIGGKQGGILANITYPADFIYENLQMEINVIHCAYKTNAKRLLFLGSSCMYPKNCPQPIKEEYLLTGELEKTSEPYAIAKIAGIKLCQAYRQQYGFGCVCVVPATIYGPADDFNLETGHVISSLIRKFYTAKINNEKQVVIWGTGIPRREFIYVDDLVEACVFLMNNYENIKIINIGVGEDITIKELTLLIKETVGFKGEIIFDKTKPDGPPQKLLDNSKITELGWKAKISLKEGIARTCSWYKKHINNKRW